MVLNEFDSRGHKISYDKQGNIAYEDGNPTFEFIRNEILPIISSL